MGSAAVEERRRGAGGGGAGAAGRGASEWVHAACERATVRRGVRARRALPGGSEGGEGLKDEGNAAYGASQYERAIDRYTEALAVDVEGFLAQVLHGNRSQAYMKLGQLARCLDDCNVAVAVDASSIKMRLRRAACRLELRQADEAVIDYERVLEIDPENASALSGLERAEEVASGGDGRKGGDRL